MSKILAADGVSTLSMKQEGEEYVLQKTTDVSAVMERNQRLRNEGMTKTRDGDHYAASIPISLLNEWALKRGLTWGEVAGDDRLLDRFLAEHNHCKIYEGRI